MSCLSFLHTVVPAPSQLRREPEMPERAYRPVAQRAAMLSTHGPAHETLTAQARRRSAHGPARNSQPSPRDRSACRLQLGFKDGGGRGRNAPSSAAKSPASTRPSPPFHMRGWAGPGTRDLSVSDLILLLFLSEVSSGSWIGPPSNYD